MINQSLLEDLFIALAAGDSLGSTSEFVDQRDMPEKFHRLKESGWPFKQVGGGMFGWVPGAPTDDTDMAHALVKSAQAFEEFDGEDVAMRFLEWLDSGPKDVGVTIRAALEQVRRGTPWYHGGLADYKQNPENAANGSLMRNGVMPGMAADIPDALRVSVLQSLITHYAPLPAICCAAQSWLILRLQEDNRLLAPGAADWHKQFAREFAEFLQNSEDPQVVEWRTLTAAHMKPALQTFLATDFNPDTFDPFKVSYAKRAGYCLLTLQIAVWATAWALRGAPFKAPTGFPKEPFARTGGWTLAWVVMIGHDADTYAATAAPLIWAATGLPAELTEGLRVARETGLS